MTLLTKAIQRTVNKTDVPSVIQTQPLIPANYNRDQSGMFFWDFGGREYFFSYAGQSDAIKAYQCCAPLTAIVNRKTQAYINGKTWVLNTQGKEANNDVAKRLRKLLSQPNPLQSGMQFEAQNYCYQQIFGWSLVFAPKPVGYTDNIDATALWNIPPFMIDVEETNRLFYQTDAKSIIKSIIVNWKGERVPLPVQDCFIIKDFLPSFNNILFPESRVQALSADINTIIGAKDSINTLINFRGAQGFLSPEKDQYGPVVVQDNDKEALQKDFARYGLRRGQWQVILSSAALKWQQMGYSTKDLLLLETIEGAVQSICDGYNYPFRLLSSNSSNSLGGTDAGIFNRALYQDAIQPECNSNMEQWNNFFKTADYNIRIDKDYSHVPVLQQDRKAAAEARNINNQAREREWRNGLINLNEWRVSNGDDPLTDERGKIYFPEYVALYGDPNKTAAPVNTQNNNDGTQQNNTDNQGQQAQGGQGGA